MHIVEAYASNTCLKINKPFIYEKYYPVGCDRYITIHNSCKFDSRKYDHWDSVVRLLKPILNKEDIEIVQIGTKDEKKIKHCESLLGKTSFNQLAYVIKRSMLHLGVDSLPVHLASGCGKKIVALFSNMYACHSRPYWSKDEDVILIESDKEGDKPTYTATETPKTINTIAPEKIAAAVCKLLGIEFSYDYETLMTGQFFHIGIIETIPEEPIQISNTGEDPIYLRLDITVPKTNVLSQQLDAQLAIDGKYTIITPKTIPNSTLRRHKRRIDTIVYILNKDSSPKFYEDIISCGIKCNLAVTYGEKNTDEIKFKFLDYPNITDIKLRTKEDVKQLKDEEINKLFYQSNKYLIHKGKFYPSQAALEASVSCEEMSASVIHEIPDKPIFFKDLDHVRILKKKLDLRPPIS